MVERREGRERGEERGGKRGEKESRKRGEKESRRREEEADEIGEAHAAPARTITYTVPTYLSTHPFSPMISTAFRYSPAVMYMSLQAQMGILTNLA